MRLLRARQFRLTTPQRRSFISSLFGLTFVATVLTVSASAVLPCPARSTRARLADAGEGGEGNLDGEAYRVVVEKRPRRWIEEKHA